MALADVWGPAAWRCLHAASFESSPKAFAGLVTALRVALPCPDCREAFDRYCEQNPLDDSGLSAAKWAWALHNTVNRKKAARERSIDLSTDGAESWAARRAAVPKLLSFDTLVRRHAVFSTIASADDVFGLVLIVALYAPTGAAHTLAFALAQAFPLASYTRHLRAAPEHNDPFDDLAARRRAYCIATQAPIETAAQLRARFELAKTA